jgi:glycosyltransferase involved in cell wall biosynthesis
VPKDHLVSIVTPVYNEEESLSAHHDQLISVLRKLGRPYEVIYVDDGSQDSSFAVIETIAREDSSVRAVRFARNFGQTAAITAGIQEACGQVIIMMDADGQNDPADIPLLLSKIDEGYDVVSGWRHNRQDTLARRLVSSIANKLISRVTGVHLHDYGCSLKAYHREVIKNVRLYGEMHRFIPALASLTGASIAEVKVRHHKRKAGKSKYGMERIGKVLLDLITLKFLLSFSTKPIYFFGLWGGILLLLSGAWILIALLFGIVRAGVMGGIFMIAGFQFIFMGLISEMLVRIYHESQDKPIYFVKERRNCCDNDVSNGDD